MKSLNYFIYFFQFLFVNSQIISPTSKDVWYAGQAYDITWKTNLSQNLNLNLLIFQNNKWQRTLDNGNNFLSLTIDSDKESYQWHIPLYLSSFWESPMKIELSNYQNRLIMESGIFNIPGITINYLNNISNDQNLEINWRAFNDNPKNIFLYSNDINYYSINNYQKEKQIGINILNSSYNWLLNQTLSNYNSYFKIVIMDNFTFGISNEFYIENVIEDHIIYNYSNTTTPITNTNNTCSINSCSNTNDWILWLIIGLLIIGLILIFNYLKTKRNHNNQRNHNNPSYQMQTINQDNPLYYEIDERIVIQNSNYEFNNQYDKLDIDYDVKNSNNKKKKKIMINFKLKIKIFSFTNIKYYSFFYIIITIRIKKSIFWIHKIL